MKFQEETKSSKKEIKNTKKDLSRKCGTSGPSHNNSIIIPSLRVHNFNQGESSDKKKINLLFSTNFTTKCELGFVINHEIAYS